MSDPYNSSLRPAAEYNLDNKSCREDFILTVLTKAKTKIFFTYQSKNKQDKEDLEQDVYLKIQKYCINIHNAYTEKGEGGLRNYISRMVKTQIAEKEKIKRYFSYMPFEEVTDTCFYEQNETNSRYEQNKINNELDINILKSFLSPKLREAIELRYQEDLAAVEAAHKMGITVNTFKSYLAEAKNKLRFISWQKN